MGQPPRSQSPPRRAYGRFQSRGKTQSAFVRFCKALFSVLSVSSVAFFRLIRSVRLFFFRLREVCPDRRNRVAFVGLPSHACSHLRGSGRLVVWLRPGCAPGFAMAQGLRLRGRRHRAEHRRLLPGNCSNCSLRALVDPPLGGWLPGAGHGALRIDHCRVSLCRHSDRVFCPSISERHRRSDEPHPARSTRES